MTAQEIEEVINRSDIRVHFDTMDAETCLRYLQVSASWEIALQLAIMNEAKPR